MSCQRCGLEGCKGHRGNVVSEVIHLQYIKFVILFLVCVTFCIFGSLFPRGSVVTYI